MSCEEQLNVLPTLGEFGAKSLKIFTTRNGSLCIGENIVCFEKDFLEPEEARKLFCHHAFNSEDIPEELQKDTLIVKHVEGIVNKCDCLPLSLEVIGKHAYVHGECGSHQDAAMWDCILDKLSRAQPFGGNREDRLFANLLVSYDALAEDEQEMFRDIATFFFEKPLDVTLAAIGTSKRKSYEATECWKNLVRRSLVKEIIQESDYSYDFFELKYQEVWMHEHLRDLGKRLAGISYLPAEEVLDKINSDEGTVRVHDLRSLHCTSVESRGKLLKLSSLAKLTKLRYLTLYRCMLQDATQDFPRQLALIQWDTPSELIHDFPGRQLHSMTTLAVLELKVWDFSAAILSEELGTLVNLMILEVEVEAEYYYGKSLPLNLLENFGELTKLQRLTLIKGSWKLPESFGRLSSLESLTFDHIRITQLPDSFGSLPRLKTLIVFCPKLTHFPESFGKLCKLEKLFLGSCFKLEVLPNTFGNLTALRDLFIDNCHNLRQLPHSFSNLSGLRTLIFRETTLVKFVGAFQNFSTFEHMENLELELLNGNLPQSFSHLSSKSLRTFCLILREENILREETDSCVVSDDDTGVTEEPNRFSTRHWDFPSLEGLTLAKELTLLFESLGERVFGDLIELHFLRDEEHPTLLIKELYIVRLAEMHCLPDCIGNLTSLQELGIDCKMLETLPESLGWLGSLRVLRIESCWKLKTLPESLGWLGFLKKLDIKRCKMLETLPESMGQLGSLKRLTIELCEKLEVLPESMEQLGSLKKLWIRYCDKLVTLPEGMGNLISLKRVTLRDCRSLKAVPRVWGLSSPEQASTSSSSSSSTGLTLEVTHCPSLDNFVKTLNWDSIHRTMNTDTTIYVRKTRLS